MPASRQELLDFIAKLGIVTVTHEHAPVFTVDEAKAVHGNIAGGHCKNLFCKDEKGVLWLIVALEDAVINLKAAPGKIGSKRLTFGKPDLLMEILGVSWLGNAIRPDQRQTGAGDVILDASMMKQEKLNFHPLRNDATTTIASDDLLKFISACGHTPRVVAVSD